MFGEQIQHVHLVLVPRGKDVPVPEEHRSAALIINQRTYVDREANLQAAARIREVLQAQ